MSEPKTNIPKFASFRPKPTSTAVPEEAKAERSSERKHHRGKDETRDKDRRKRQNEKRRSRSREKILSYATELEISLTQPKSEPQAVFVVDWKGDEKNLVYGSIHRYSIPHFHRFGAGHVLGASQDVKIDRDYGDEKGIILSNWRDWRSGSRERYVFSKVERERPRFLKIRPQVETEGQEGVEADFVPLQHPRGKKRKRSEHGAGDSSGSDHDERDYRSIYGMAKLKNQPPDEDLDYATESDSSGSETGWTMKVDASIRQKNMTLSRRVEEDPHDVEAWIALIDHQDALMRSQNDRHRVTSAEIQSTADIKIHMYEKALDNARSLEDRERLLIGLMKEGEKIWEVKDQSERWEQISKENIGSTLLWTSYLNFKQTTFSSFRHEDIKEIFMKRINTLSEAALVSGTADIGALYQQQIYLLLRFTLYLRESGYLELAVSIWQGLLEINFFSPSSTPTQAETIKKFGAFWETELPRIGEDGALGWRHFVEKGDTLEAPDALVDETEDTIKNKALFKTWAVAERLRMRGSRIPARTMDDVAEDDPFRVILFSDIENFLIYLPRQSKDLRNLLLDGLLLFCRLPAVCESENARKWSRDAFVNGYLLEDDMSWIREEYFSTNQGETEVCNSLASLNVPIPNISTSSEELFGLSICSVKQPWKSKYAEEDNGPVAYKWVRNILKQLTDDCFVEHIAEYYLAFEFLNEPATIKKVSKSLLKRHPTSLRLYNSYALIEWARGNKDVARGVFSAALNLRASLSEGDWGRDSIVLWRSWIWACFTEQDNNAALQHLLSIVDGTPNSDAKVTPAALLRVRQYLTYNRDYLMSLGSLRSSVAYTECLMLLDYLTGSSGKETTSTAQGDISSALDTCISFSQTFTSRDLAHSTSHELFLQSATRLLLHHTSIGPFRPALIREYLTRFLNLFPQNTIFLSLYTWNESRLRIDNRVRNILLSTVLTRGNDTLTSRLFAIQYEIHHGTIHSTHSAFEHALSSPPSKSSAGLWKFYIIYCLETPQFRAEAKDVWYRSIRACPWAKELYLIGFESMSNMLTFSELKNIWRIMGEKDLRVQVDLEERFEDMVELESSTREQRQLEHR
ncbi:DUF1740-domain-containing protein [Stipitochalara longipes BDJ]|nr:DUF1740-domain-containing protein [Stipitochalara longipes BDJ]